MTLTVAFELKVALLDFVAAMGIVFHKQILLINIIPTPIVGYIQLEMEPFNVLEGSFHWLEFGDKLFGPNADCIFNFARFIFIYMGMLISVIKNIIIILVLKNQNRSIKLFEAES